MHEQEFAEGAQAAFRREEGRALSLARRHDHEADVHTSEADRCERNASVVYGFGNMLGAISLRTLAEDHRNAAAGRVLDAAALRTEWWVSE